MVRYKIELTSSVKCKTTTENLILIAEFIQIDLFESETRLIEITKSR